MNYTCIKRKQSLRSLVFCTHLLLIVCLFYACSNDAPPMASAIHNRQSQSVMSTYGVSKLISDSGVIRYKIIAEQWDVYDQASPPKQSFPKGLFLEKFDEKFHVELFITADTAYCYNQNLWELRGRVFIRNINGVSFSTEELFWDMGKHEMYSNMFTHIVTPEKELQGFSFKSNEQMTKYEVYNNKGSFVVPKETTQSDSSARQAPARPLN